MTGQEKEGALGMHATKITPDEAGSAGPLVTHLLNGQPVVIPYLTAGHHRHDDPASSPIVSRLVAFGDALARHPYSGAPMALVGISSGRLVMIELEALAHSDSCLLCSGVWARLERTLDQLPPGSAVYEQLPVPVFTVHGAATLVLNLTDKGPRYSGVAA